MQSSVMFLDENCSWDTVNNLLSFPDFLIACSYSTDFQVTRYETLALKCVMPSFILNADASHYKSF
jgi:hypothetical protein